jgi:hypothetical protein
MGETNKKRPYCKPWNAGLASETPAVCRRLGRLFDALDTEINTNIADGQIIEDVRQFRSQLRKQLLAEGWSMSYLDGNKMRVRPPGHKKPYGKAAVVPDELTNTKEPKPEKLPTSCPLTFEEMNMKNNEIEVNKTYILVGFERNRAVKVMEKSQNEIWVRMPEGDLMPVDAEDLRETKATAPEPVVGRGQVTNTKEPELQQRIEKEALASYGVEVQMHGSTKWTENELRFPDSEQAELYGRDAFGLWVGVVPTGIQAYRVASREEPPNYRFDDGRLTRIDAPGAEQPADCNRETTPPESVVAPELVTNTNEPKPEQQPKAKNTYTVFAWCVRPFRGYAEVEAETPKEAIVTARGLHDDLIDTAEACSHKDYPWDEFAVENENGEELVRVLDDEAQSETTGATPETVSGRSLSNTNTEREGEFMSEQQPKQTQSTEQPDSRKQQPIHKETHGAVEVKVWDNGPDREPSVSFGRPYRGPQGWGVAHSYRAKHLSDLMKATAAAALALGRELERRPQTSAKGKAEQVCSIDSGRFTAVLGARWNATAEAYTYGAKILCDGKQVFGPMLNHELAGLQRIAQEEGLPWLATAVEKRRLPEPTTEDLQHFEKTLRASQALIGRFIERGHKEVLQDTKLAEELGLEVARSVEPGQEKQALTIERER